jgi:predicted phosphoribosyltransferase
MTRIFENKVYRNRTYIFRDRSQAGEVLADMLEPYRNRGSELIVLAIPMGGVPVAVKIRDRLACPMDLIIARKIQIPGNTEAGFGAVTSEGDLFLNKPLMASLRLTVDQVEEQLAAVRKALAERNRRLRDERPFPDVAGKTVFIVDDGVASGYTLKAAVFMVKKHRAAQIIAAVPTAPKRTLDALSEDLEAIYCTNVRHVRSFAVAAAYTEWHDLSESEVLALI